MTRWVIGRAALFLSASLLENHGLAQLEALADGALLVTAPSAGALAALPLARRLAPDLVAEGMGAPELARAIAAAAAMPEPARAEYRRKALKLLAPYSRDEVARRVEHEALPILLGASRRG